jgi:hypothetical protein
MKNEALFIIIEPCPDGEHSFFVSHLGVTQQRFAARPCVHPLACYHMVNLPNSERPPSAFHLVYPA